MINIDANMLGCVTHIQCCATVTASKIKSHSDYIAFIEFACVLVHAACP